jgi:hypothetical protein
MLDIVGQDSFLGSEGVRIDHVADFTWETK